MPRSGNLQLEIILLLLSLCGGFVTCCNWGIFFLKSISVILESIRIWIYWSLLQCSCKIIFNWLYFLGLSCLIYILLIYDFVYWILVPSMQIKRRKAPTNYKIQNQARSSLNPSGRSNTSKVTLLRQTEKTSSILHQWQFKMQVKSKIAQCFTSCILVL